MSLKDQIPVILQYIKANNSFTAHNSTTLNIYEGNLAPYVQDVLEKTLSANYYSKIKERIIPINILKKIISKLSRAYEREPSRTDMKYQQFIDDYSYWMGLDEQGSLADEYSHLHKGYAWEPYIYDGEPKLRVIPFDRFLVMSYDKIDPMNPTVFIKFMGKRSKLDGRGRRNCEYYHVYTAEEFLSFDSDGEVVAEDMMDNQGINPIGMIPFVYGNRSRIDLIPQIDTDVLQMTKLIPVMLSDLGGAIMFQCFSIVYGIDVQVENLTMSPNAFWNLTSDPKSDKNPQLGVITPTADVPKIVSFITSTLSFWLESIGVRVGSVGSMDASNTASGIAKIIDEMDAYSVVKRSIKYFTNEEYELWELLPAMNNYWVKSGQLSYGLIGDDFDPKIEFPEPKPESNRMEDTNIVIAQLNAGLIDRDTALKQLYPAWSANEIAEELGKDFVIQDVAKEDLSGFSLDVRKKEDLDGPTRE